MDRLLKISRVLLDSPERDEKYAWQMGFDCGWNGADEINCDFRIFSTAMNAKAHALGTKAGIAYKEKLLYGAAND